MGLSASESTVRRWSIPDSTLDLHTAGGKRQTRTCSALGHFVGSLAPGSSRGTPDPAGQPLFPVGPGGPAAPGSPHGTPGPPDDSASPVGPGRTAAPDSPHDTLEQADRPAFLVGPGGTEAPGSPHDTPEPADQPALLVGPGGIAAPGSPHGTPGPPDDSASPVGPGRTAAPGSPHDTRERSNVDRPAGWEPAENPRRRVDTLGGSSTDGTGRSTDTGRCARHDRELASSRGR